MPNPTIIDEAPVVVPSAPRSSRHGGSRLLHTAARLRFTLLYIASLTVTTVVLHLLSAPQRTQVLLGSSTNLDQMSRVPVRVLVASAFWISSGEVLPWAVMLGVIAGVLEWRRGSLRSLGVFVAGHVGATLVVAGGLAIGVAAGFVNPAVERAMDVGPSYGFAALAAATVAVVPRKWRPLYLLGVLCWLASTWAAGIDFTAIGHLVATMIGFALIPLLSVKSNQTASRSTTGGGSAGVPVPPPPPLSSPPV